MKKSKMTTEDLTQTDSIVYRYEFEDLKERVEKLEARFVGTKKK